MLGMSHLPVRIKPNSFEIDLRLFIQVSFDFVERERVTIRFDFVEKEIWESLGEKRMASMMAEAS